MSCLLHFLERMAVPGMESAFNCRTMYFLINMLFLSNVDETDNIIIINGPIFSGYRKVAFIINWLVCVSNITNYHRPFSLLIVFFLFLDIFRSEQIVLLIPKEQEQINISSQT